MATLHVTTAGNDSTGNGSVSTPYRLPSRACAGSAPIAASGDTVQIGTGTFTQGTTSITPAAGVTLQGAGMNQTLITSLCQDNGGINPGVGCVLNDFKISDPNNGATFVYLIGGGANGASASGFTMNRVWVNGGSDCLYSFGACSLNDCILQSKWDVLAQGGAEGDTLSLNNVTINVVGDYATIGGQQPEAHGLSQISHGTVRMTGGSILVRNGTNESVAVDTAAFGQSFYLEGVYIHAAGDANAGATILDIRIGGESQVTLKNCYYNAANVYILTGNDLDPGVEPGNLVVAETSGSGIIKF